MSPAGALDPKTVGLAAKFVPIQAGEFDMGRANHDAWDVPYHVVLTQGFQLQATDVTQLQYFLVMGDNPSDLHNGCQDHQVIAGHDLCVNHPVENVSWSDARAFIAKLNENIPNGNKYRLPTEAEWE